MGRGYRLFSSAEFSILAPENAFTITPSEPLPLVVKGWEVSETMESKGSKSRGQGVRGEGACEISLLPPTHFLFPTGSAWAAQTLSEQIQVRLGPHPFLVYRHKGSGD